MTSGHDEVWSDSDEELSSEVATSVLLGVPDGPVTVDTDLLDAAVSRIGGYPVRPSPSMSVRLSVQSTLLRC